MCANTLAFHKSMVSAKVRSMELYAPDPASYPISNECYKDFWAYAIENTWNLSDTLYSPLRQT